MRILIFILIIFFMTYICSHSQSCWIEDKKNVEKSVECIENPAMPEYASLITLEKIWEIGGEDPGFIFDTITAIDIGEDGKVYVNDIKENNVKVFSSTGTYLHTFGRKGQGPGEFSVNAALTILSKDRLIIIDTAYVPRSRMIFFDLNGKYIDSNDIILKNSDDNLNFDTRNKKAYLASKRIRFSQLYDDSRLMCFADYYLEAKIEVQSIWLIDLNKNKTDEIITRKRLDPNLNHQTEQDPHLFKWILWCCNDKGHIALIDDIYDYKINIYDNSGQVLKTIKRSFELPLKTRAEFELDKEESKKYEKQMEQFGLKVNYKNLEVNPIIYNVKSSTRSMIFDEKDRLWVLTNESIPSINSNIKNNSRFNSNLNNSRMKANRSFDIFDHQGRYITKIPFDCNSPRCFVYKKGFLYFADLKDDGFPWIFKYKVMEFCKEE